MLVQNTTFPLEIGDTIIDSCSDDRAFLKACSVVCTSWARRARYHLFSRIRILVHPHCITPQRLFFENILERDPKVAVYVRYMEFRSCFPYGSTVPPTWTGLSGFSLDRFPRLSSVKLSNFSYPSITSLIYLISQFSFVASLDLDNIRIVPVAGAVPSLPRPPTIQHSHNWSLRTLSLRTHSNDDNPPEQRSLAVGLAKTPCLTSLTSLRLHVGPAACGAWAPSLPASLHHLVISINAIFSTGHGQAPLQSLYNDISRMYEALRACTALRSLTLICDRRHTPSSRAPLASPTRISASRKAQLRAPVQRVQS
ncbi:hypothetical protein C8Q74DRAFT_80409 [Fomes fomentarius]|nr:hypothetical protein C8Q74DRAFT_80409 [Fomes fomentarius]